MRADGRSLRLQLERIVLHVQGGQLRQATQSAQTLKMELWVRSAKIFGLSCNHISIQSMIVDPSALWSPPLI
jgi:hypothetical protein